MFDFEDTTYSVLVALLSMAVSIAYPVITSVIQHLDGEYHNDFMVRHFERSHEYKTFGMLAPVTLVCGLLMPFLLFTLDKLCLCMLSFVLLCIQALLTFFLTITLVCLCRLVMVFYSLSRTLDYLAYKGLPPCVDVLLRAAEVGNRDVYLRSVGAIADKLHEAEYRRSEKPVIYTDAVYNAIEKIAFASTETTTFHFLSTENWLAELLYDEKIVSERSMGVMWTAVNRMADANGDEWFRQYWMYANQYCQHLKATHDSKMERAALHDFQLMHFAMGGLMMFKRKHEWLKMMTTFTQSVPYTYPLVPDRLKKILTMLQEISPKQEQPFGRCYSFLFLGLQNDVNAEKLIYGYVERYAALLLMKPGMMSAKPDFGGMEAKDIQRICENLKKNMEDLLRDGEIKRHFSDYVDSCAVDELCECLKSPKNDNTDDAEANIEAIKQISDEISKQCDRLRVELPPAEKDGKVLLLRGNTDVPRKLLAGGTGTIYFDLIPRLVADINKRIYTWYAGAFLRNTPIVTYTVQDRDAKEALRVLRLNEKYAITLLGVEMYEDETEYDDESGLDFNKPLRNFDDVKIYCVSATPITGIAVARLTDLPRVSFGGEPSGTHRLTCADRDNGIYHNAVSLTTNNRTLTLGRAVTYNEASEPLRFVMIRLVYDRSLGECDLPRVKRIKELLG